MPTLDWLNRAEAFNIAGRVPYRLLEPVSSHGTGADNLLIQGDNLEALKSLLPFYRGQVKCIFIDPPYNTKSAFEHYDDNLEHAQWLSMMLPRLQLLRELLREDGSIWVTIDDNEGHYLKVLMDEVFGRKSFVATNVWQKRYSRENREAIGDVHDYVLVYARSPELFKQVRNLIPLDEDQARIYRNSDDPSDSDPSKRWRGLPMTAQGFRPNQMYVIVSPNGSEHVPPKGRCWSMVEAEFEKLRKAGRIYWGKDGNAQPSVIRYLSEVSGLVPWTWWKHEEVGHTDESKKEANQLFTGDISFGTPKPERLIQRIVHISSNPGDLVLDSFLGSGTTAAVAHKMGRRWIGIEMGEHSATHCLPRLEKVIEGEQGGISKTLNWQGGGGFRFMKLGAPVFDENGRIHPEVRFATLAAYVWQQETGEAFNPAASNPGTPYLGTHYVVEGCPGEPAEDKPIETVRTPRLACYLLFNGILGDKRPAGGNVLTRDVLAALAALHAQLAPAGTPLIVYGESVRVGPARLAAAGVTFKQIPYDISTR